MTRRVSVHEARANFSELLGSVYHTGEPIIIERRGKPVAVLISPEQYGQTAQPEQGRISEQPPEPSCGWAPRWINEAELARRQATFDRARELRARMPSIAPLTSVDLMRIARAEELEPYGLGD